MYEGYQKEREEYKHHLV